MLLWLQASYGDDMYAIGPCVSHFPSRYDHEQIWLPQGALLLRLVVFSHKTPYLKKMRRTLIDLRRPKLDLNQSIASVIKVENRIRLQAIPIPII